MSEAFFEAIEELAEDAHAAANRDGINRLKAENQVIEDACKVVEELSEAGDMTESDMNALADQLADILARYNKTDLKGEFSNVFTPEAGDGIPFDEIINQRLESLEVVHSTDAKQGAVWRWEFSDGVQLETQTSKDGGRKHHEWHAFKEDYFDALVSLGQGERIAKPNTDLRDPEAWADWINDLILNEATPVEHVGPRTEAVRMLRDFIDRSIAYLDMAEMRDRQGVYLDADDEGEAMADGGATEIRVPTTEIKRICDQVGVSTRALQIELNARGLTCAGTNSVAGATYVGGQRVAYWSLTSSFADPQEVVANVDSPAEQVRKEEAEEMADERTAVGAVEEGRDDQPDPQPTPPSPDRDRRGQEWATDSDEHELGKTREIGTDPDGGDADE